MGVVAVGQWREGVEMLVVKCNGEFIHEGGTIRHQSSIQVLAS